MLANRFNRHPENVKCSAPQEPIDWKVWEGSAALQDPLCPPDSLVLVGDGDLVSCLQSSASLHHC